MLTQTQFTLINRLGVYLSAEESTILSSQATHYQRHSIAAGMKQSLNAAAATESRNGSREYSIFRKQHSFNYVWVTFTL